MNERIKQVINRAISGGWIKEEINCFLFFQILVSQLIDESILLVFFILDQTKLGKSDGAKVSLNNTLHLGSFQDLNLVCIFFRLLFYAFTYLYM